MSENNETHFKFCMVVLEFSLLLHVLCFVLMNQTLLTIVIITRLVYASNLFNRQHKRSTDWARKTEHA